MKLKAQQVHTPTADNLRNLLLIRSIALLVQAGVLAYVMRSSGDTENLSGVIASLTLMAAITVASLWRTSRSWPVADSEFLSQLLIDVLGWSALMYFTGGANNPFVSYFIVPVVIAAAVLPRAHTYLVAIASLLAYSALLKVYQPFPLFTPHAAMGHDEGISFHIVGMWFNFLFSVGLITYFVVRMASTLRKQEEIAGTQREDRLRNDQIMAVASLAAGTAHELGTPLSTMAVLVDEMLSDPSLSEQAQDDCRVLQDQIAHCKDTMGELSRTAELGSVEQTQREAIGIFTQRVLERWAVRRPGVQYTFDCEENSPELDLDITLAQAVENLLNNAADAGSEKVALNIEWNALEVNITIRDWGHGLAPEVIANLGKPVIHANRSGLGIGLMLSQATVERYGGRVELRNCKDGGVLATLSLPLLKGSEA